MAKPKKQTKEERLRKKRLAEKKRYQQIKENEELWKEKQEKNRQSYLRRKEEKKQLSIQEMNPRQQRAQRKRWRKNFRSYYLKKKQENRTLAYLNTNTPPSSPIIAHNASPLPVRDPIQVRSLSPSILKNPESPSPGPSRSYLRSAALQNPTESMVSDTPANETNSIRSSPSCSYQAVRQMRYKKDMKIKHLQQMIMTMKKKNESYRKQIERLQKEKSNISRRPVISVTRKFIKNVRKTNEEVKKVLSRMPEELKTEVAVFYEEDENSRMCSGKKEFIVRNKIRKQKRYLTDSLLNLHRKFLKNSAFSISYSTFCKLRPFWVLEPSTKTRDTCMCTLHTNLDLLVEGLHRRKIIRAQDGKVLLSLLCCDAYDVNCLHQKCSICKERVVPYQEFDNSEYVVYSQWVTKQDVIQTKETQKKIRTTEKVKIKEEPLKCIEKLESMLLEYFTHCGNIAAQQKSFKALKTNLKEDECIIHIDFSENYAVKCNQEIQAYHFGGSRRQITLHTSVLYLMDEEKNQQAQSFCTVSDCLRHDVAAVWAHIVPILEYLAKKKPNLQTLHFISDSPSSQYRNKKIFHLISALNIYLSSVKTITWNYSEAGHGKGAPDGVGATLKSAADRAVSQGQDIKDINDFMRVMEGVVKNVILRTVSEYDVSEKDFLIPQIVKPFVGSMKMHQIIWTMESDVMAVRKLSCTENECLYQAVYCTHDKHLGFYSLNDRDSKVTPLCAARNYQVSSSFWTGCTESALNKKREKTRKDKDGKTTNIKRNENNSIPKTRRSALASVRKPLKRERNSMNIKEREDIVEELPNVDQRNMTSNTEQGDLEMLCLPKDFNVDLENIDPYMMGDDDDDSFNIF